MLKKAIDIKTLFKTTSNKNVQFLMRTHGETATKFYNIVSDLVQDKDYVLSELGSELGRTFALLRTDTLRFFPYLWDLNALHRHVYQLYYFPAKLK